MHTHAPSLTPHPPSCMHTPLCLFCVWLLTPLLYSWKKFPTSFAHRNPALVFTLDFSSSKKKIPSFSGWIPSPVLYFFLYHICFSLITAPDPVSQTDLKLGLYNLTFSGSQCLAKCFTYNDFSITVCWIQLGRFRSLRANCKHADSI